MQRLQAKGASEFRSGPETATAGLLLDSLRNGEPVVVLTGAAGIGKTTVLDRALAELGSEDPLVLRLEPPFPTPLDVQRRLQALLDLNGPTATATPADIAQSLLLRTPPAPGIACVAVVLDGAEAAPAPLLQYLWLMHRLTSLGRPALQLILVGTEAMWRRFGEDSLAGLRQGVTVRLTMQPYPDVDAQAFVAHLLRERGCWVEADASAEIVTRGAGVPGEITTLVDAACAEMRSENRGGARSVTLSGVLNVLGTPSAPQAISAPVVASDLVAAPGSGWARPAGWGDGLATRRLPYAVAIACVLALAVVGWQIVTRGSLANRPPVSSTTPPVRVAAIPRPAKPVPRPVAVHAPERVVPSTLRPGLPKAQVAFEMAGLAQPPRSLLSTWDWPLRSPSTPPGPPTVPAARVVPHPAASKPAAPSPAALSPAAPSPAAPSPAAPSPAGSGPAAAKPPEPKPPAPLLVMADATAAKASVLFPRGDQRDQARALQAVKVLRQAGVETLDPVAVPRSSARPGIGFFFGADRPAAEAIARSLAGIVPPGPPSALPMPSIPPPPGAVQVMLGPR